MVKVVVAEDTGFCYGVKRAINIIDRRLKEKKMVSSLGPIIHNRLVMEGLEKKGLKIVGSPSQIKGNLIVRSHGLHPVLIEEARKKKIKVIDATCPFVRMVQRKVKYLITKGYSVIIVGDSSHPEVKTLAGFARDEAIIIDQNSTPGLIRDKTQNLKGLKKVGVVSQTTINIKNYHRMVIELYQKINAEEFLVFNTICEVTGKRQREVGLLSRRVDFFLVLGSKESSNTKTLYEICRRRRPSFLIEDPSQIKKEWFAPFSPCSGSSRGKSLTGFKRIGRVGLLSGTSTPDWVVKKATDVLRKLN